MTLEPANAADLFATLVHATQYGDYQQCRDIIEAGLIDVNTRDQEGISFLHWSAINNRIDLVKFYISHGIAIDPAGGELMGTPLQWAIRQGHLRIVVLLVLNGADPSIMDSEGLAAIHIAAQFAHTPIVAYLVGKGQSIDQQDRTGHTPTMWAAHMCKSRDPLQLLCYLGADLGMRDFNEGHTALHWAVLQSNETAVRTLLKYGAPVALADKRGTSCIDLARSSGNGAILAEMELAAIRTGAIRVHVWRRLKHNRKFQTAFAMLFPFVPVFAISLALEASWSYWWKLVFIAATLVALKLLDS